MAVCRLQEAPPIDWDAALASLGLDESVPEVLWATPGAKAGMDNLDDFLLNRLKLFATKRNDPNVEASSGMSPWIKFGQVVSTTPRTIFA